jgi:hypothetical protein
VYPNPTSGELIITIEGEYHSPVQIEIYNIVGKLVGSYGIRPENETIIISVESLASGMYFLKVDGKTVKFVKE